MNTIGLTMGDPAGIGLEIAIRAWGERFERALPPFVFHADPDTLAERARRFGQAFETVRYTASALTDMAVHALPQGRVPADPVAFDAQVLRERGLPPGVGVNHRFTHFQHLFYGSSYAAGYYVYLWAEVLDADAFDAFTEAGSAFDATVAGKLLKHIYAAGDSVEPGATYEAFRGRAARIESNAISSSGTVRGSIQAIASTASSAAAASGSSTRPV